MAAPELADAIVARWNAAGLDTAIATLYAGGDEAAPERTSLPRAQYRLLTESDETRARGQRVIVQPVRFQVWAKGYRQTLSYVNQIENAFVNSDAAGSDPYTVAASVGSIASVLKDSSDVVPEVGTLHQGILQVTIRWTRSNLPPSS